MKGVGTLKVWGGTAMAFVVTFVTGFFALDLGWLWAAAAAAPFALATYLALAFAPVTRPWSTSGLLWFFVALGIASALLGLWLIVTSGAGAQRFFAWIPVGNAVVCLAVAAHLARHRKREGLG